MASSPDLELAHLACFSCNSRKRKCDKRLPCCSNCSRKGVTCTYPSGPSRRGKRRKTSEINTNYPSPVESSTGISIIIGSGSANSQPPLGSSPPLGSNEFPAVFYLDLPVFQKCSVDIQRSAHTIPPYILSLIGNASDWEKTAANHFVTVHRWMPIISKKRFYEHLLDPQQQLRSDYALIILVMGLMSWIPRGQNPRTPAYIAAKSYYLELELQGIVSLQALQALLYIHLFEYGHANYPSTDVSIEACIRYARALGIFWDSKPTSKQPFAWVDLEEQNRVVWAINVAYRVCRVGHSNRAWSMEEPVRDVFLPSHDVDWDQGIMPAKRITALSLHTTEDPGKFAITSETAKLLGKVLRHVENNILDSQFHEEALLLDRALLALTNVVELDNALHGLNTLTRTSMCSLALMTLHEAHISRKTALATYFDGHHRARLVAEIVKKSLEEITTDVTGRQYSLVNFCVEETAVIVSTMLYHAASANLRMRDEDPSQQNIDSVEALKRALNICENRWTNSAAYLKILEAKEMPYIQ